MKTHILDLTEHGLNIKPLDISLSLMPFVRFLKKRIESSEGMQHRQLSIILEMIQQNELWQGEIDLGRIGEYQELLELVYTTLSSPLTDENENYWALSLPFTPKIIFGTKALFGFLETEAGTIRENLIDADHLADKEIARLTTLYGVILEKLYGLSTSNAVNEVVHFMKDEVTGLNRYFKVEFDSRFVEITFDGVLPEINFDNVQLGEDSRYEFLTVMQQLLPLDKFRFTGFSILNIKDITAHHVIENIKDIIVNLSPGQMVYDDISNSLQELMGNKHLDVNLMPVLKLNDKLIVNCFEGLNESLEERCGKYSMPVKSYLSSIERYSTDPQIIFRKNVAEVIEGEDELFPLLREMGVEGLIVLPIFFQKQLVGILTVYSKQKEALSENMLSAIEPAIPLLEQLLQTTIDDFNITLDNTVKEKFTSLQPSVEWRFNEVAFDYLLNKKRDNKVEVKEVYFSDVYPLYGAVDIRNSTLERNMALRADMHSQLNLLIDVLEKLRLERELGLTNEVIFKTRRWLNRISDFITSDDEFQINQFFENEVTPYLLHFRQQHPKTAAVIDAYFIAIGPTGIASNNRRELEESFQMLNRTIGNLLEQMNVEIQGAYPCYFEKYRSDGIEYDIYIGQSITPNQEFHPLYLRNLRLWQLNSMAIVAKLTHALQEQLPKKLQTTQLIFIHANTIDISFRNDEHRFDVEGAYNIRYEMIKKRIDKVLISGTNERLTQPGKIALVYFQQKDVEEYISHIHYLQDQNILAEEIEYLELEELQGVNGLKALRVGVVIDEEQQKLMPSEQGLRSFSV